MRTNVTAAKTASFAQRNGSRLGTAPSEARIIPVEYSPVITSTPRTPIASCENRAPMSAMSSGFRLACSAKLMWLQRAAVIAAARQGKPIVSTTATSIDHRVERIERSFVHSERITRAWVTRRRLVQPAGAGTALISAPARARARGLP